MSHTLPFRTPMHVYRIRTSTGLVLHLSLTQLGHLIRQGELGNDVEVATDEGLFRPMAEVVDLHSLALTLEALGHLAA